MKTRLLKTAGPGRRRAVRIAAKLLRDGELVAFPTETVYGLGGNALDRNPVRKIFRAKGRPPDNPLIVHIVSLDQIHLLTSSIPLAFWRLADEFMPGPLTVVLKKSRDIPAEISAGLQTVAVRMPDHPVAKALLRESGLPIVAPSANRSGRPSPTRAEHVLEDLEGRIAAVLDGGRSRIGLESTVLDLTKGTPVILRPGAVTLERLESALGKRIRTARTTARKPASPGMKYRHYAPKGQLVLFEGRQAEVHAAMREMLRVFKGVRRTGVMVSGASPRQFVGTEFCSLGTTGAKGAARRLFEGFREMDRRSVQIILCQSFDEREIGAAVMNRLKKAATQRIKI